MKNKLGSFLLLILSSYTMQCTVETAELAAAVRTKVFDTTTGTLFLGLEGGSDNALSRINRFSGFSTPTVHAIGSNLSGKIIEYLSLCTEQCQTYPLIAAVAQNTEQYEQTVINVLTRDGSSIKTTDALYDEIGETITKGIVGLAASSSYLFAAVRPNGDHNFGDVDGNNPRTYGSGIGLVHVNKTNQKNIILTTKNADTGGDGNKAKRLDKTSAEIKIQNDIAQFGEDELANDSVRLVWDEKLNRLYIALWIKTGNNENDGGRSIVVARVNANESLSFSPIAPDSTFADDRLTNVIGVKKADTFAWARKIGIMHTSTGGSYLIISGNVYEEGDKKVNSIYALPLVDNLSNTAQHGTLANKNTPPVNGKFTDPATADGDLLEIDTDRNAILVGAYPLPVPATTLPSDMVIIGDTVYVSIEEAQGDDYTYAPGIFSSQALFDENGKIARWTTWAKRSYPFDGFESIPGDAEKGRIKFFAIDAVNGKVWAIDGDTKTHLASTTWSFGNDAGASAPTTLTSCLNRMLTRGCFSVLDLNQSVRALGNLCPGRYALFGGLDKVVFARISEGLGADYSAPAAPFNFAADGSASYPEKVVEDFSSTENILETFLPTGAGPVTSLEFSRRILTADPYGEKQNYFFAGTQNGLYVFAKKEDPDKLSGFTADENINKLNAAPFSTGSWFKMNNIRGSVIAMTTSGNGNPETNNGALYILTMEPTMNPEHPMVSRIYSIPFAETYIDMNSDAALIAQSEVTATNSDLGTVREILGLQIVSTTEDAGKEQLVIATNQGLYSSHASQTLGNTGIILAKTQAAAAWAPISATDTTMYSALFGLDTEVRKKIWPMEVADNTYRKTFSRSSLDQLNSSPDAPVNFSFLPKPFNSTATLQKLQTLSQSTGFWSDGARRFFIINWEHDPRFRNRLMVMPFDTYQWYVCSPDQVITDPRLSNICVFYWIEQIGASGIMMVGTNNGIVALQ